MNLSVYSGPRHSANVDWHHYTFTLVATDLDPKALEPSLTQEELAIALKTMSRAQPG